MDFLVDGKSFYRVTRDASEDFRGWPFDQPFHLILNLAVGGDWGGRKGVDPDIWPSRMLVDWVRVYQ
jgi:beta-glucanase (GH16 family)